MSSVEAEQVDAAMLKHLSDEVARLEAENAVLQAALNRPVNVTVTPSPLYDPIPQQVLTALQGINGAIYGISSTLNDIKTHLTANP